MTSEPLDEKALQAAAELHDRWTDRPSTIGSLNAIRNTREIVAAYLSHRTLALPSLDAGGMAGLLLKQITRAEDNAGTLPAKQAVKLRPDDWYAVCQLGREVAALLASRDSEIERLREERDDWQRACMEAREGCNQRSAALASMHQSRDEVLTAIGSVRWMDPPDGGSVTVAEQVRRMRSDLEAAEARLSEAMEVVRAFVNVHDQYPESVRLLRPRSGVGG